MAHPATPASHDVVTALMRALNDGPITLEARDLGDLAAQYWPADGHVALHPDAGPARQAEALVHALDSLTALEAAARRPALRLIPGGAA